MAEKKTLVIMVTHGAENPEKATIPYVLANAALASGIEVIIGIQATGVYTVSKECYKHIFAAGFPPLKELVDTFIQSGGKIYVCGPCINSRQMDVNTQLIEGSKVVNAATFVNEMMKADKVLFY